MAIVFVILAGFFVALSNLCMRKSIDSGGTTKGFLVFQMGMGFVVSFFLNPVRTQDFSANMPILVFAAIAGIVTAVMLFALGRAVENGPAGFTFSIIASATVLPGILMSLFFGPKLGFPYTPWHGIGSLIVIAGLFWAGKGMEGLRDKTRWLIFSGVMFGLHTLLLVLYQLRSLLLNSDAPETISPLFTNETIRSQWFTPFMFLVATLIMLAIFIRAEKRWPYKQEALFGVLGGSANAICTFFMIWATEVALPLENAIIFPIFSVMSILLSNLWGQKLYEEKVNWKACQLSAAGLIIGTVDWKTVMAYIGL